MNPMREIPTDQEARLILKVDELQNQLEILGRENAALRYQRDLARADVKMFAPRATPEEEAHAKKLFESAIPNGLTHLIDELEAVGVTGG